MTDIKSNLEISGGLNILSNSSVLHLMPEPILKGNECVGSEEQHLMIKYVFPCCN